MPAIFDLLYREYCRACLAEMRKQLLIAAERPEAPEMWDYDPADCSSVAGPTHSAKPVTACRTAACQVGTVACKEYLNGASPDQRLMAAPATHYVKSDDVHIAYQVLGNGPLDLVFVPGFVRALRRAGMWRNAARSSVAWHHSPALICFDEHGTRIADLNP
jgi:hypothetical protein